MCNGVTLRHRTCRSVCLASLGNGASARYSPRRATLLTTQLRVTTEELIASADDEDILEICLSGTIYPGILVHRKHLWTQSRGGGGDVGGIESLAKATSTSQRITRLKQAASIHPF
jgi:hypothetical protein